MVEKSISKIRVRDLAVVALTIVFIVLKLKGVIAWSWLWVLSPLWICVVVGVIAFIVGLIIIRRNYK